jgi:hypothetical protein
LNYSATSAFHSVARPSKGCNKFLLALEAAPLLGLPSALPTLDPGELQLG